MRIEDNEPLWREVVGNTEPWKRGHLALVLFGVFTAGQQFLTAATIVASGNIELLLPAAIFSILQWLQFYLIWIGVQWIRYLAGGLMAFGGLAQFFHRMQPFQRLVYRARTVRTRRRLLHRV